MARVTSPFLSKSAQGHFGGVITAYGHTGRAYIIEKKKRKAPVVYSRASYGCTQYGGVSYGSAPVSFRSTGSLRQTARRYNFAGAWPVYNALTQPEKDLLSEEARQYGMTGANLFMSQWLKSHPT
jgi:hypothetical protein